MMKLQGQKSCILSKTQEKDSGTLVYKGRAMGAFIFCTGSKRVHCQ